MDILDHIAGDNDAGVGAGLTGGIHHVLPDQAGSAGNAVHIEEQQGAAGMDAGLFVDGVVTVSVQTVHTQEPAVLSVHDAQLTGIILVAGVAHGRARIAVIDNEVVVHLLAELIPPGLLNFYHIVILFY